MNPFAYIKLWRDWLRASQAAGSFLFETAPLPGAGLWKRWHTNSFLLKLKHFPLDRSAKCIVDIGANVGLFSRAAELYCPGATILSVEPSSRAFAELSKIGGARIIPVQCAVGATAGKATLFIAEHLASSTLEIPDEVCTRMYGAAIKPSGATEEVRVVTLARLLEEHKITKVDLLKIDVEGSEPEVLAGAADWLGPKIERIIIEVSIARLSIDGSLDLIKVLTSKGYSLVHLVDVERSNKLPSAPVTQFDAWFARGPIEN